MIIQKCVKGISGTYNGLNSGISKTEAFDLIRDETGIMSNWWRQKGAITPTEIADILTSRNLDRHLHDYQNYGPETPFISLAAGSVERLASHNQIHSAIETALEFATDWWQVPGALSYCWVQVGLNPAVEISGIAEEVRNLHTYRRWSPYQLEGEITAKIHVPANQIEKVEWWDGSVDKIAPLDVLVNRNFSPPERLANIRELY